MISSLSPAASAAMRTRRGLRRGWAGLPNRRLPSSLATMDEPTSLAKRYPLLERAALGLATVGGIGSVACISALPSAQCREIAETYYQAISCFGPTAIAGLGIWIFAHLHPTFVTDRGGHAIQWVFIILCFVFGTVTMVAGMGSGQAALSKAVTVCWPNNRPIENPWHWMWRNWNHR